MQTLLNRLDPARGAPLAAGVLALTVAVVLVDTLFGDDWRAGGELVFSGLPAALALAIAAGARQEEESPPPWLSVVLVSAFVLAVDALFNLADALGASEDPGAGTTTWVGVLVAATFAWLAVRRNSAICTLLAAATGVVTLLAFVDWAFGLENPLRTFRWLLLLVAAALFWAGGAPYGRNTVAAVVYAAGLLAGLVAAVLLYMAWTHRTPRPPEAGRGIAVALAEAGADVERVAGPAAALETFEHTRV